MKNPLLSLVGVVVCSISIPILISIISYDDIDISTQVKSINKNENIIKSKKEEQIINYETVDKKSPIINVYNHKLGKTQAMDMEEYLWSLSRRNACKF